MASTFSTNLKLELQGTGEHVGTWGSNLNTNSLSILDTAFGSVQTFSLSNIDVVPNTAQTQVNAYLLTGTLTGNVNITWPAIGRTYYIANNTTGAFSVTLKCGTGAVSLVIPQGYGDFFVLNPGANAVYGRVPAIGTAAQYLANTPEKVLTNSAVWAAQSYIASNIGNGGTATPDMATASNFYYILAGSFTLANPTNMKIGQSGMILLTTTTGSVITWGSKWNFQFGARPLISPVPALDVIVYTVFNSGQILTAVYNQVA